MGAWAVSGQERESLTLKWGTLKAWNLTEGGPAFDALKRCFEGGRSVGAAMQRDTPEQKQAICDLIDALDAESVFLDWDGKYVSKDEAKAYVVGYGKRETTP